MRRAAATAAMLGALALVAQAQTSKAAPPSSSALDAALFYQLLIGEMELRGGQAGTAYEVMLDAARRTRDEALFRRATEIALSARAGEQALASARAWRSALPQSLDAQRYAVQILVALNRVPETVEPMQSLVTLTPEAERAALIMTLPRFFTRNGDRKLAIVALEQVIGPYLKVPATALASEVALGRGWLLADDRSRALEYALRAHARDALAEDPALLALELMPATAGAEAIVTGHLAAKPKGNAVRLAYVQSLAVSQRYADAIRQLETVTASEPQLPVPWLTLGAMHLELRHPREAEAALNTYVKTVQDNPPPVRVVRQGEDEADETLANPREGLMQAWLLLAQAAEQRGDYAGAEKWLARVDNPQRALEVQLRRASLLARQNRVADARELVRRTPERSPEDARAKLLAEAQVLRDVKQWSEAGSVLALANQRFPNDPDLLYEQSMMSEKQNRLDEMERLLRRVIELKPDHHHAYNALGYSLAERNMRLTEAKSLIQQALTLMPGEPFVTDSLGWVEYRLGNREEALRLLRAAYAARPDVEIAAHLGEVLWVSGQREEALRILREARSRDGTNDVLRETVARLRIDL